MISVAMITMNEEGAVESVVRDIRSALGEREHEIVIVDSSKDRTPEIAEKLGVRNVSLSLTHTSELGMAHVILED